VFSASSGPGRTLASVGINPHILPEAGHVVSNGYSNMWIINPGESQEIVVEYRPQILFYMAGALSLGTLIVIIGYFLISKYRSVR